MRPFIGISGLIGAGKSTLASKLALAFDVPLYKEPVEENEYLSSFYGNPEKYGFAMQIYLLSFRFEAHQNLVWQRRGGVQDRTIYEDAVFAKTLHRQGLMSELDFRTYRRLAENMFSFLYEPDIIVHLDVTPEKAMERIKERGRESERGIPLEYLQLLNRGYEELLEQRQKRVRILRLDWEEFQPVEDVVSEITKSLDLREL